MSTYVRDIDQHFWSNNQVSHLTIRRTISSVQGYKAHSHDELSIGLIESGTTCSTIGGREVLIHKNEGVIIAPNVVHACNPVSNLPRSYQMLYIDNKWCCDVLSRLYDLSVTQFECEIDVLKDTGITKKLSSLCLSLIENVTQETISEINHHLYSIISRYCAPSLQDSDRDKIAYQVKARLLDDFINPPSILDISKELSRPTESLIRSFKRQFGTTPKSFLNSHRIEKAKLLLKSGMNIVDVACEVGFSDQSQFHKAFVNYTASTPRQYQATSVNFRQ
ncbi:AraC family transcriptional regulator [Vibrio hannami]|uniref:AraC family transcriptional regulator n=1 Tax=Vibrio hannami TaxID=2717094 RepID=UPI00240FC80F|nr:AraC family transcriptional regulator [Vibrio hannami]MDG3087845.1 AraC family transcriptional regulator [Vibrio hannami]